MGWQAGAQAACIMPNASLGPHPASELLDKAPHVRTAGLLGCCLTQRLLLEAARRLGRIQRSRALPDSQPALLHPA